MSDTTIRFDNNKKGNQRDYIASAIVADKGIGKSTFTAIIAMEYVRMSKAQGDERPVLIDDRANARAFREFNFIPISIDDLKKGILDPKTGKRNTFGQSKGIYILKCPDETPAQVRIQAIKNYVRNCCVIFDEFNEWAESHIAKWAMSFFTQHRNLGLDVFAVCHSILDIPSDIRGHFYDYYISVTTDSFPLPFPTVIDEPPYELKIQQRNIRDAIRLLADRRYPEPDRIYYAYALKKREGRDATKKMQSFIKVSKINPYDYLVYINKKGELVQDRIKINLDTILKTTPYPIADTVLFQSKISAKSTTKASPKKRIPKK